MPDELMTTEEVAKYLKVPQQSLNQARYRGKGLPYVKLGRSVHYRRSEVDAYLEANTVRVSA